MLSDYWKTEIENINDDNSDNGEDYNLTREEALELSKQIMALSEEKKSVENDANPEIERLKKWRDDKTGVIDHKVERLRERLLEYYRVNKEQDSSFKLDNPYAHIIDRKKTTWNWFDDNKTISALEDSEQTDLIKVKKSIDKTKFKKSVQVVNGKVITHDGSLIDGVTVTEGRTVTLKVEGD